MSNTVANVPSGNKSVKSAIQFTVGTNNAKLNVNVSGQTAHIYVI